MKSSLHQSLPPLTFQLLTDNLTRLATFDCFHYIRWVKKEIIAILVVLGSASFLGWALSASFVLETYCIRRSRIHRFNHLSSDGSAAWALVTGASGGIGYEIVRELARRGFNVILHGRDEQDLLTAMVRIHEEFPVPKFKILVADPTVLGSKDFWYRKSYGTGSWSVNLTLG